MIAIVLAGLALVQAAPGGSAAAGAAAKAAPEKPVCVSETETGSTLIRRVCHTREEWARIQSDNEGARISGANTGATVRPSGPR